MVRPCGILGGAFLPPTKEELCARQHQTKEPARMRLKLVAITSLLAAVVGAGSCIALVLGVFSRQALASPGLLVLSTFLLPLATIIFASIFVYRHTARRRRYEHERLFADIGAHSHAAGPRVRTRITRVWP